MRDDLEVRLSKSTGIWYGHFRKVAIRSKEYPEPMTQIPGTRWYMATHTTLGDVADSIPDFLGTWDAAIPIGSPHYPERGVWSYKNSRIFGEFVSLESMLIELGRLINLAEMPEGNN